MGRRSGLDYVHLLDQDGREVKDPFLPLDIEFWNGDRTRYTFFFDPGRVKKGITPREEMGPSLVAGRRYTLVIDKEWLDAEGLPLSESFRRQLTVTRRTRRPWIPGAGKSLHPRREPATAWWSYFDKPLDHGLLLRALGVRRGKRRLGERRGPDRAAETRWMLTPADPWSEGSYHLVALSILEDRAGNRIGRAFEVDRFDEIDSRAEPEQTFCHSASLHDQLADGPANGRQAASDVVRREERQRRPSGRRDALGVALLARGTRGFRPAAIVYLPVEEEAAATRDRAAELRVGERRARKPGVLAQLESARSRHRRIKGLGSRCDVRAPAAARALPLLDHRKAALALADGVRIGRRLETQNDRCGIEHRLDVEPRSQRSARATAG